MSKKKISKKMIHDCLRFRFGKCYIRRRDTDEKGFGTCISSGQPLHRVMGQAGHYIPNGSCKYLTWNEDNVHLQSMADNVRKHGNFAWYRDSLIRKIGIEKVEELEKNKNIPKQRKERELLDMIRDYKKKARALIPTKSLKVQKEILGYLKVKEHKKWYELYE